MHAQAAVERAFVVCSLQAVLGWLLYGERLSPRWFVGVCMLLVGVWLITTDEQQHARRQ